jgi:hypothetical protein
VTLDPSTFEVVGTLDGDALDVLAQLLIDLDNESQPATAAPKTEGENHQGHQEQ